MEPPPIGQSEGVMSLHRLAHIQPFFAHELTFACSAHMIVPAHYITLDRFDLFVDFRSACRDRTSSVKQNTQV